MMRLFERPNFNSMKYPLLLLPLTGGPDGPGPGAVPRTAARHGLNVDFRGGTVYAGQLKDGEERG